MHEVFAIIGPNGCVLWSDASRSPVRLPDSRTRWEVIWERREQIVEIAHTHPVGPLAFSHEDETTMRALESALGRAIVFSVIAPNGMIRSLSSNVERVVNEPWWASLLRDASGMTTKRSLHPKSRRALPLELPEVRGSTSFPPRHGE